jgi:hypothetical protein
VSPDNQYEVLICITQHLDETSFWRENKSETNGNEKIERAILFVFAGPYFSVGILI